MTASPMFWKTNSVWPKNWIHGTRNTCIWAKHILWRQVDVTFLKEDSQVKSLTLGQVVVRFPLSQVTQKSPLSQVFLTSRVTLLLLSLSPSHPHPPKHSSILLLSVNLFLTFLLVVFVTFFTFLTPATADMMTERKTRNNRQDVSPGRIKAARTGGYLTVQAGGKNWGPMWPRTASPREAQSAPTHIWARFIQGCPLFLLRSCLHHPDQVHLFDWLENRHPWNCLLLLYYQHLMLQRIMKVINWVQNDFFFGKT